MAIAFQSAASQENSGAPTTNTFNVTTGGSDRILFVWSLDTSAASTTTATYNGVAMTVLTSVTQSGTTCTFLYLLNPTTGVNSLVVTRTVGGGVFISSAASYSGVTKQTQPDKYATNTTASGTTFTQSLTPNSNSNWIIIGAAVGAGGIAAGTGSTVRTRNSTNDIGLFDSNAAISPPANTSLAVTMNSSSNNLGVIVSFGNDDYVSVSDTSVSSDVELETIGETVSDTSTSSDSVSSANAWNTQNKSSTPVWTNLDKS